MVASPGTLAVSVALAESALRSRIPAGLLAGPRGVVYARFPARGPRALRQGAALWPAVASCERRVGRLGEAVRANGAARSCADAPRGS